MGNSFASLVLLAAPIIVIMLFRRLPPPQAFSISIVGGYLLLPTSPTFNLPFLPVYGKAMAVALPSLVMVLVMTRSKKSRPKPEDHLERPHFQPGWVPQVPLIRLCLIGLMVSPVLTALTNGDALVYPLRTITGLSLYDAASGILSTIFVLLPFLLARKLLAQPEDQKILLAVICVAALCYSLPTLWEARLSPQLNSQIYGFFPHDWRQHLRSGGYRPLVFLEHGLRLGLFLSIGILATAITARIGKGRLHRIAPFGVFWLFATIVVSKNLTALIIVSLLLPVALFLRPRSQIVVAAVFSGLMLLYPMMRAASLVPLDTITNSIASVASSDRVASLNFRLMNEETLLDRARERPLFGWGGWGRSRAKDAMGRDASTTDGTWIIEFGESGWFGYLAKFGLLTLPILLFVFRKSKEDIALATSGLALLLAANLIDLLPNSGLTPITWLMAGALAGRLEAAPLKVQERRRSKGYTPGRSGAALGYQRPQKELPERTATGRDRSGQKTRRSSS